MNTIKGIDFIHRYVGNEINQIPILPCQFPSHQPFLAWIVQCTGRRHSTRPLARGTCTTSFQSAYTSHRIGTRPESASTKEKIQEIINGGSFQFESLHLSHVHLLYAPFSALLSFVRLAAMTRRIDTASMTYLLPESNVTHLCDWHQRAGKLATGQAEQPF